MRWTMEDWPVKPMEPVRVPQAFDASDFLFQIKWDGVRCLAYRGTGAGIRLFNRRLNERTLQYPDLVGALSFLPPGTVTDGEIVALGADGKPSFPLVLQRDLLKSPIKIKMQSERLPVLYMVFDVLWLDGTLLLEKPLYKRLEILKETFEPGDILHVADAVEQNGRALFAAVAAEGMEGIVAKQTDSPYLPGRKTPLWQKIKCWRELEVLVGGYLQDEAGRLRSLLVGVGEDAGLRYVGSVASGITQKQRRALHNACRDSAVPCPFINPPQDAAARWADPGISLRVRFLEFSPNGSMRNPSLIRFTGGMDG